MILNSDRLGQIEFEENDIIIFEEGLLGFNDITKFLLIPFDTEENQPFYFMQSIDNGQLCFIVVHTLSFFPNYEFDLTEDTITKLDVEKAEDVQVLSLVTVKDDLEKATTNLLAPLVVNAKNKRAEQVVLQKESYALKQPLFKHTSSQDEQQNTTSQVGER